MRPVVGAARAALEHVDRAGSHTDGLVLRRSRSDCEEVAVERDRRAEEVVVAVALLAGTALRFVTDAGALERELGNRASARAPIRAGRDEPAHERPGVPHDRVAPEQISRAVVLELAAHVRARRADEQQVALQRERAAKELQRSSIRNGRIVQRRDRAPLTHTAAVALVNRDLAVAGA